MEDTDPKWIDSTVTIEKVVVSNEQVVDELVHNKDITKPQVEEVFRKIHRANYISNDMIATKKQRHLAWSSGNLDLYAPDVYAKALEALDIKPEDSFLNVGSGTGYLSTMAGLLIESDGVNHGVEAYMDKVDYACNKLKLFKKSGVWYDPLQFCEPKFFEGNIYQMTETDMLKESSYDKIFVGATCNSVQDVLRNRLPRLLKVGGTIVLLEAEVDILANGNISSVRDIKLLSIKRTSSLTEEFSNTVLIRDLLYSPKLMRHPQIHGPLQNI